ncbi:CocE/NonD family hydrolase [Conexibacter sp. JD483]|uniref:CocE/NonD family hydrolase n=1 Tax=unclassified Conexibacter TaxID=2627773 RepID=UPI002724ABE8|nr:MULTISPECIES: alpha/beta fold hydrolase [unclassified Conexibacter]MDO8187376.1 CocE/NonD family hydrolase [Conexibacter sp. CPCC 205706]MDO8200971.1 CocE/NonD family hydrolase [Conexibacter sp. CPCC 205762]MDR9371407.1 CocE/NonD family hydrolase [Conexibacter sp. JD483]
MRRFATLVAAGCCALGVSAAPANADPTPFGHACTAQNGVRFCPTTRLDQRVPSFDNLPIDVDVTLPASGNGPFPTIVLMHGLGGDKAMFQDTRADGSSALTYHYNNVFYAQKGYAVVTPTARGFGNSCGAASKTSAGCASGWTHLDDTRYEARDAQTLLGKLVDQGIADPAALGATGVSYGGGTSAELAFLKDRVRLPDGSFSAWRSPAGTSLRLAAAYPRWGWAELGTALIPNGRANDTVVPSASLVSSPPGVAKLSYTTFLYLISALIGNVAPSGADAQSDLTGWYTRLLQGEPYTGRTIDEVIAAFPHKGTVSIPGVPAPMLIENGWTDALFTAQQGVGLYNQARAASASADVSLTLADTGHMPASNRSALVARLVDDGAAFFDAKLRRSGSAPAPSSVKLYPLACSGPDVPTPRTAASWTAAHPGALAWSTVWPQSTTSTGLNYLGQLDDDPLLPAIGGTLGDVLTGVIDGSIDIANITGGSSFGQLFTQALQNSNPCRVVAAGEPLNSINSLGPSRSRAFTLVGMPTVTVDFIHTGADGQLAARLWDVGPDGRRILVTRGVYRVGAGQTGRYSFQLDGSQWTFAPGHRPRVDILSTDSPYVRPSNLISTTTATRVAVSLPTAEVSP